VRKNIYGREVVRCGKGGEEKVQGTRLVAEPDLCSAPAILFFLCSFFLLFALSQGMAAKHPVLFFFLVSVLEGLLCYVSSFFCVCTLFSPVRSSLLCPRKRPEMEQKNKARKTRFFFMFIVEIRFFLYRCRSMSPYFVICVKRVVLGTRCFDSLC